MKEKFLRKKYKSYRKFFRLLKKSGMFKAVIYDGESFNEYCYPGIRMDSWKAELIVLFILVLTLVLVLEMKTVVRFDLAYNISGRIKIENRVDRNGISNLHKAVINNKEKFVKKIVQYGADINSTDEYGWTPLHWAKFLKRSKISEFLINHGALSDFPSEKDWFKFKKGTTPDSIN